MSDTSPTPVESAALELVKGFDGTLYRSWPDVVAHLRDQSWPESINPEAIADLIDALLDAGLLDE